MKKFNSSKKKPLSSIKQSLYHTTYQTFSSVQFVIGINFEYTTQAQKFNAPAYYLIQDYPTFKRNRAEKQLHIIKIYH